MPFSLIFLLASPFCWQRCKCVHTYGETVLISEVVFCWRSLARVLFWYRMLSSAEDHWHGHCSDISGCLLLKITNTCLDLISEIAFIWRSLTRVLFWYQRLSSSEDHWHLSCSDIWGCLLLRITDTCLILISDVVFCWRSLTRGLCWRSLTRVLFWYQRLSSAEDHWHVHCSNIRCCLLLKVSDTCPVLKITNTCPVLISELVFCWNH
jgi:hypothetical protein